MRRLPRLLSLLTLLALVSATPLAAREKLTGEQELAKLLAGRVAGKPIDCIDLGRAQRSQVIDHTAIVYDMGSTLYVNRPRDAASLDSDETLVTKLWTSQLCRMDTITLHDREGGFYRGFISLEQFVPYKRVKTAPVQPSR